MWSNCQCTATHRGIGRYEKELDAAQKAIQRKYDLQKSEDDRVHRVNIEAVSKEYEAELDRRRIRAAMCASLSRGQGACCPPCDNIHADRDLLQV